MTLQRGFRGMQERRLGGGFLVRIGEKQEGEEVETLAMEKTLENLSRRGEAEQSSAAEAIASGFWCQRPPRNERFAGLSAFYRF